MGMIYQLAFHACTVYGLCHDVSIPIDCDNPPSVYECAMYGQGLMARWAEEHPGYTVRRFRCGAADKDI